MSLNHSEFKFNHRAKIPVVPVNISAISPTCVTPNNVNIAQNIFLRIHEANGEEESLDQMRHKLWENYMNAKNNIYNMRHNYREVRDVSKRSRVAYELQYPTEMFGHHQQGKPSKAARISGKDRRNSCDCSTAINLDKMARAKEQMKRLNIGDGVICAFDNNNSPSPADNMIISYYNNEEKITKKKFSKDMIQVVENPGEEEQMQLSAAPPADQPPSWD